ncbi:MAG: 50S ribosome-binding GTPase [Thermaerobacter sp.]|nr:50S ribosome-binding GTPase [Thermaerobacter sp.]
MRAAVVVGGVNVGKSLLVVNFAAYCGERGLRFQSPSGAAEPLRPWSLGEARRQLVSPGPHAVLAVQGVAVTLTGRGGSRSVRLWDTPGLVAGVARDPSVRRAMADGLAKLAEADLVLHVVDVIRPNCWGEADQAIAQWRATHTPYAVVANQMDRPGAREGLKHLRRQAAGLPVVPVSALTQQGFAGLRRAMAASLPVD